MAKRNQNPSGGQSSRKPAEVETQAILQSAVASHRLGQHAEAEMGYREVLRRDPSNADALHKLGLLGEAAGDLISAHELIERAASIRPSISVFWVDLARVQRGMGHRSQEIRSLRKAVETSPGVAQPVLILADALLMNREYEECLMQVEAGLMLAQDHPSGVSNKVLALGFLGRYDEAQAAAISYFEACKAASTDPHPIVVNAYANLAMTSPDHAGDAEERLEATVKLRDSQPRQRAMCYNAIGQLRHAKGEHKKAFEAFATGKQQEQNTWSQEHHAANANAVIQTYSAERVRDMTRSSTRSSVPVFIVGMPRTGQAQLERMIDAHPKAAASGELMDIWGISRTMHWSTGVRNMGPELLEKISKAHLDHYAGAYVSRQTKLHKGKLRVTDSMPTNFLNLGLIAQLFPGARVIHMAGDPIDSCFSCFTTDFISRVPYNRSLRSLGMFYKTYERVMAHWAEVLPLPMLTVNHGDLMANPEGTAKGVLEFLELPWDDAVLGGKGRSPISTTMDLRSLEAPLDREPYGELLKPLLLGLEVRPEVAS